MKFLKGLSTEREHLLNVMISKEIPEIIINDKS